MLQRLDLNGDGAISRSESRAGAQSRFERLDGDGNGVLTEGEMRAAAERTASSVTSGESEPDDSPRLIV